MFDSQSRPLFFMVRLAFLRIPVDVGKRFHSMWAPDSV